jgi:hypothetical protein
MAIDGYIAQPWRSSDLTINFDHSREINPYLAPHPNIHATFLMHTTCLKGFSPILRAGLVTGRRSLEHLIDSVKGTTVEESGPRRAPKRFGKMMVNPPGPAAELNKDGIVGSQGAARGSGDAQVCKGGGRTRSTMSHPSSHGDARCDGRVQNCHTKKRSGCEKFKLSLSYVCYHYVL